MLIEHTVGEHVGLEVTAGHCVDHVEELERAHHGGCQNHDDGGLHHWHSDCAEECES